MNHTTLNIFATLLASSTAMADLALQGLGTGPAPTSIGGYALTAAAPDNRQSIAFNILVNPSFNFLRKVTIRHYL